MSLPKVLQKIINNVGYGQALTGSDNDIVHKSSNETINGLKTFLVPAIYINHPTAEKGVYPDSGAQYWELYFGDANSNGIPDNDPGRIGELQLYQLSSGRLGIESTIRWVKDNINKSANIGVVYDSIGDYTYGYCPSTPLPSVNNENTAIVTRDFIPNDTRIVHTTGDEHISGAKIFDALRVHNGNLDYTSNTGTSNDNEYISFFDANDLTYSAIQTSVRSDLNRLGFRVMQLDNFSGDASNVPFMGLVCSARHPTGYGICPTIDDLGNNDDVIVTTKWIRTATGNTTLNAATATDLKSGSVLSAAKGGTGLTTLDTFVRTSGNQYIDNIKWFTSSICKMDPNNDMTTLPTSNHNGYICFVDKNDVTSACMQNHVTPSNNMLRLMVRRQTDTSTALSGLPHVGILVSNDNTYYTLGPSANNLFECGNSSSKWKNVWAVNGTIQTSDRRQKSDIQTFSDDVLDVWENVSFVQFRMNHAIESKGNKARIHAGIIAQDVEEVFSSANLDGFSYGFLCHDSWEAQEAEYDQDGNLDTPAKPAGDEYSIRYEEALCIEAAYNRRRVSRLEEKIKLLEQKLNLAS